MVDSQIEMFHNRLQKLSRHLDKQARKRGVGCYRLYDHDLPEFPFCIDRYADKLYVAEYKRRHGMDEEVHGLWLQRCLHQIAVSLDTRPEQIYTKLRQRKPGRGGQYQRSEEIREEFFRVEENGLSFWINLTDYLDTGLFLDHRDTRALVRSQSSGKRVLNLFAYTGSFSVYAAAGGASEVTTVDLSNTYLEWAKRNMQLNGFALQDPSATGEHGFSFVQADVKKYLQQVASLRYDIIVMDPPTFSNSKRMDDILEVQRDHPMLIREALRILSPEGILYFSTNFTKFELDKALQESCLVKDITKATTPFDFAGRANRFCFRIQKKELP
ncbi:MAG: class I SAM-dependent methyltransferase [Sphingomonadales bacterium]